MQANANEFDKQKQRTKKKKIEEKTKRKNNNKRKGEKSTHMQNDKNVAATTAQSRKETNKQ